MIEKHRAYVKMVTALSDEEGKRISAAALGYLKKLLKASRGNPHAFAMLVKRTKPAMAVRLKTLGAQATSKSASLGREFMGQKK